MNEQQNWISKEDFKKKKAEERKQLYDLANKQLHLILYSQQDYIQLLKIIGTLNYTVTNSLLIMSQNKDASFVKDYSRWKELDCHIKPGQKGIKILVPSSSQSMNRTFYDVKHIFDVTQTTYKGKYPSDDYPTIDRLLEAMTYKNNILIKYVDEAYNLPRNFYFNSSENTIYAKKSLPKQSTVFGILREYVISKMSNHSFFDQSFVLSSILSILFYHYGLDTSLIHFNMSVIDFFINKEEKECKQILQNIKSISDEIIKQIDTGLFALKVAMEE